MRHMKMQSSHLNIYKTSHDKEFTTLNDIIYLNSLGYVKKIKFKNNLKKQVIRMHTDPANPKKYTNISISSVSYFYIIYTVYS